MKKFFGVIGNPPFDQSTLASGDNGQFAPPMYDKFMEESFKVGDKVELVHPARFLFNAGSTPAEFNRRRLNDPHFKVLMYEQSSAKVFANTSIMGGIAVTYHDESEDFGAIGTFTPYEELNSIVRKVSNYPGFESLVEIIYQQDKFDLDALYADKPECEKVIGSGGRDKRFRNNCFEKVPVFTEERENATDIAVFGVTDRARAWRYIPAKYIDTSAPPLRKWKIFTPAANGSSGMLCDQPARIISMPIVAKPDTATTQTFMPMGAFDTEFEAEALLKYVKSKFARVLLAVLKITQDCKRPAWAKIPLQDFTPGSDIDWSKSIAEIDQQLYAKYGLDQDEIDFIEFHIAYLRED